MRFEKYNIFFLQPQKNELVNFSTTTNDFLKNLLSRELAFPFLAVETATIWNKDIDSINQSIQNEFCT